MGPLTLFDFRHRNSAMRDLGSPIPESVLSGATRPGVASHGFIRRLAGLLVTSTVLIVLGGTALAQIDAPRPVPADDPEQSAVVAAPDLTLLVADAAGPAGMDPLVAGSLIPALLGTPGVDAVRAEVLDGSGLTVGRVAVHVDLEDRPDLVARQRVTAVAERTLDDYPISIGGRAAVDDDIVDRLHRSAVVALVPAVVVLLVLVVGAFGARLGLGVAGTVALSATLGGTLAGRFLGSFDGTLATTAVPAAFVAALVSTTYSFRLLDWYRRPVGHDPADIVRRSIRHLLPEIGLVVAGLVGAAAVSQLFGPGRSVVVVCVFGAVVAVVVTLAALPALLVSVPSIADERFRAFRLPTPDGRDLPRPALYGLGAFLALLAVFSLGSPSARLLDRDDLPAGEASRRVSEQLVAEGGDPTDAILVTVPAEVSATAVDTWARTRSADPIVGWIETGSGRYAAGELVETAPFPERFRDGDRDLALVVPAASGRAEASQALAADLALTPIGDALPTLQGVPVDAESTTSGSTSALIVLVMALAVAGGAAIHWLLRDRWLSLATVGLRLLGSAASVGVYRIISSDVAAHELHALVVVVNVGVSLFEIGFLRRIALGLADNGSPDVLVGDALRREGRAAMFGLALAAVGGLGFVVADIAIARQFGLAVAAGAAIELAIGMWLLRPVVQGEPAATRGAAMRASIDGPSSADAARSAEIDLDPTAPDPAIDLSDPASMPIDLVDPPPFEVAAETQAPDSLAAALDLTTTDDADALDWRRIVAGLLRAEFESQVDPAIALVDQVFVEDTPLHAEVAAHTRRLLQAGLHIEGAGPILRSIQVVNDHSPAVVSVTVEHPERHLVSYDGRQIGRRAPEIRNGMLWLIQDPSGRYRIAEAIDMGASGAEVGADEGVVARPAGTAAELA